MMSVKPILFTSAIRKPAEPFLVPGSNKTLAIKRGEQGYTVMDGRKIVASYDGTTLIVDDAYKSLGIGPVLIRDFRKQPQLTESQITRFIQESIDEAIAEIIQEEMTKEESIDQISKIIDMIINFPDYQANNRFDYDSNKKAVQAKLEAQLGIYDYSPDVYKGLVSAILEFLFKLHHEDNMPKTFVKGAKEDYFDCKLSEHWNELKKQLVQILTKNVQNDNPKADENILSDEMIV